MIRRLWAFYKRDWQLALTYRFGFFGAILRIFAGLLPFFFIGKMVPGAAAEGNYFRFVLLGISLSGFTGAALSGFKQMIAFEQGHGTLEALLATPTSLRAMALGRTLWSLTSVTAQTAAVLLIGSLVFHADLSQANWAAVLPVMALTGGVFLGLGMILAGFFLIFKESGPLEFLFGGGSRFLAGVYFPVGILPVPLQTLSRALPLTYALTAVRKAVAEGASLSALGREVGILALFSALFLPAGWFFFRWALGESRRRGTLGFN